MAFFEWKRGFNFQCCASAIQLCKICSFALCQEVTGRPFGEKGEDCMSITCVTPLIKGGSGILGLIWECLRVSKSFMQSNSEVKEAWNGRATHFGAHIHHWKGTK